MKTLPKQTIIICTVQFQYHNARKYENLNFPTNTSAIVRVEVIYRSCSPPPFPPPTSPEMFKEILTDTTGHKLYLSTTSPQFRLIITPPFLP